MPRPARRLPVEERIDPLIRRREDRGQSGNSTRSIQSPALERELHRLRLEHRLAAEEVRDRPRVLPSPAATAFASRRANGPTGIERSVEQLASRCGSARARRARPSRHSGWRASSLASVERLPGGVAVGDDRTSVRESRSRSLTGAPRYIRTYVSTYIRYVAQGRPSDDSPQGRVPGLVTPPRRSCRPTRSTPLPPPRGSAWRAQPARRRSTIAPSSCSSWPPTRSGASGCARTSARTGPPRADRNEHQHRVEGGLRPRHRPHAEPSPAAPRAAAGYIGYRAGQGTPYYSGAFAATLTDSVSSSDALMFLGGANLGAALYEYGVARLTRAFLRRRRARAAL